MENGRVPELVTSSSSVTKHIQKNSFIKDVLPNQL